MEKPLEIFLEEYRQLKAEQLNRIGFRDNLIYVSLTAFGAISSFAATNELGYSILLVIPWVCIILGWTYLVNDEKITSIGSYIKSDLIEKIKKENINTEGLFGWENFHSTNQGRKRRKINQLFIDIITFIAPAIIAIVAYDYLSKEDYTYITILIVLEIILLIYLLFEFINHSNF